MHRSETPCWPHPRAALALAVVMLLAGCTVTGDLADDGSGPLDFRDRPPDRSGGSTMLALSSGNYYSPFTAGETHCVGSGHGEGYAWDFMPARRGAAGDAIRAVADGVVRRTQYEGGQNCTEGYSCSDDWANYAVIFHPHLRVSSLYLHLMNEPEGSALHELEPGDEVRTGQVIGHMGDTGYSDPANVVHLHFQFQADCDGYWCKTPWKYTDISSDGFADIGLIERRGCYGSSGPWICGDGACNRDETCDDCAADCCCTSDGDCSELERCDGDTCARWTECANATECAVGKTCQGGSCGVPGECLSDADCGELERCDGDTCARWAECADATDCDADETCQGGYCVVPPECLSDADCGELERCDGDRCVRWAECAEPTDCAAGETCEGGSCVVPPECLSDADCGELERCDGDTCVRWAECADATDCAAGETCEGGSCVVPPECLSDADCGALERCDGGTCIVVSCGPDNGCAQHDDTYVCVGESGTRVCPRDPSAVQPCECTSSGWASCGSCYY